jgi:hypothetical protein
MPRTFKVTTDLLQLHLDDFKEGKTDKFKYLERTLNTIDTMDEEYGTIQA